MNIEEIEKKGATVVYRIEADASEVDRAFADGLEAFIQQFQLDELEGDTPREKIVNALGEEEAAEVIESAVISFFIPQALKQLEIIPLSSSDILEKSSLEEGKPFTFSLTVMPKPSFELSDYSTFTVTVPEPPVVTDEDIDTQIQMLAQQFAEQSRTSKDAPLTIPAVTDTWVQQTMGAMGVNTVEELRQAFRAQSERALQEQYQQMVLDALMEEYFKRFTGTVTDEMVDAMTSDMVEQFKAEQAQLGMSFEDYCKQTGRTEAQIRERLADTAKDQLIQGFVLDAIYAHEKLSIDLPDLMAMIHMIAPGAEEETFEAMDKTGRTFLLKEGAQRNKALAWISENNTIEGVKAN